MKHRISDRILKDRISESGYGMVIGPHCCSVLKSGQSTAAQFLASQPIGAAGDAESHQLSSFILGGKSAWRTDTDVIQADTRGACQAVAIKVTISGTAKSRHSWNIFDLLC